MMRQKIVTLFIFPMALLILTSHSSLPQEKIDDSNIPVFLLQKISIRLSNTTFETVLNSISGKSNIQLNYNRNRIPVEQVISVDMENIRVVDVLRYVLDITNTELRVSSGNQILIVPADIVKNINGFYKRIILPAKNT